MTKLERVEIAALSAVVILNAICGVAAFVAVFFLRDSHL